MYVRFFFFSSRRRHTRCSRDWSSDVCSSDLAGRHHGRLWLRVPETIRVEIRGKLAERTGAKDVILKVIGTTGDDGARYAAVEFTGPMVKALPMNERFVLCNMTTEMGAKVGMIEADSI